MPPELHRDEGRSSQAFREQREPTPGSIFHAAGLFSSRSIVSGQGMGMYTNRSRMFAKRIFPAPYVQSGHRDQDGTRFRSTYLPLLS